MSSVAALEMLVLMQRASGRPWHTDELVRELRSSTVAVDRALAILKAAELVRTREDNVHVFEPISPHLGAIATEVGRLYDVKPITLIKAVMTEHDEKLRIFSDAFKFKE